MLIAAWQQWVGINSRMNPRLLAPGMGVDAIDFRQVSGDLRPWILAPVVHTLAGLVAQAQSIHRLCKNAPSDNLYWLTSLKPAAPIWPGRWAARRSVNSNAPCTLVEDMNIQSSRTCSSNPIKPNGSFTRKAE